MPDRETVITHLQIIHTWAAFARERDLQFFTAKHLEDIAQWADDALALINEQKETIQITKNVAERYGNILADIRSSGMSAVDGRTQGRSVKWDE